MVVPFFLAFQLYHLMSEHPALTEGQEMRNEPVQLVCLLDVVLLIVGSSCKKDCEEKIQKIRSAEW